MKVYLGGGLQMNSEALSTLTSRLKVDYFDPSSLPDDFHSYKISKEAWSACNYCLYVLTPLMKGFDMVVNAVDDSNKRPKKTMYCFVSEDDGVKFTEHQIKSLKAIGETISKNGARWFESLEEAITFLNKKES